MRAIFTVCAMLVPAYCLAQQPAEPQQAKITPQELIERMFTNLNSFTNFEMEYELFHATAGSPEDLKARKWVEKPTLGTGYWIRRGLKDKIVFENHQLAEQLRAEPVEHEQYPGLKFGGLHPFSSHQTLFTDQHRIRLLPYILLEYNLAGISQHQRNNQYDMWHGTESPLSTLFLYQWLKYIDGSEDGANVTVSQASHEGDTTYQLEIDVPAINVKRIIVFNASRGHLPINMKSINTKTGNEWAEMTMVSKEYPDNRWLPETIAYKQDISYIPSKKAGKQASVVVEMKIRSMKLDSVMNDDDFYLDLPPQTTVKRNEGGFFISKDEWRVTPDMLADIYARTER